ncbi:MAG: deoxynucleoside kinase [Oscillospiraceae bacterium]
MSGKLIVIEGLDGSGKATQAKLLYDALKQEHTEIQKVSFPNYDSPSSSLVKMYLDGQFGDKATDTGAYAASCFYTVDRFASYKTIWGDMYNNGGIVIADRYTTSNAIHQCSKLPRAEWDNYLDWLFDFEYNKIAIPKPQLVIYLDVNPEISQKLMTKRYGGNEGKKDIHERDTEYLLKSRQAAEYCAQKCNWITISCTENGDIRPMQQIHNDIVQNVNKILF